MAYYRQIHTRIWKDTWFHRLPVDLKMLFVYLFSNDQASLSGLYEIPVEVIAFEIGMSEERVREGLALFHRDGKVLHDDGWLWVVSLLHYNAINVGSAKIVRHLHATLRDVPENWLKERWMALNGGLLRGGGAAPDRPPASGAAEWGRGPRRDGGGSGPGGSDATGPRPPGEGSADGGQGGSGGRARPGDQAPGARGSDGMPESCASAAVVPGAPERPSGACRAGTPGAASATGPAPASSTPGGPLLPCGSSDSRCCPSSGAPECEAQERQEASGSAPAQDATETSGAPDTPAGGAVGAEVPTGPPRRVTWSALAGSHARADTVSIPYPQEQDQEREHDPEQGTTESAGADAAGAPAGGSVRATNGPASGRAGAYASPRDRPAAGGAAGAGAGKETTVPTTFAGWSRRLLESTNRPATLRVMFQTLYPGHTPPAYGYLGKVARSVGGAGRLAELLWQHSTRPPTGDVLAYVLATVRRGRQQPASPQVEPAGFEGIRNWMKGEGMLWPLERQFASAS